MTEEVTLTGRVAGSEPNMQTIAPRTEEGQRIREAFTSPPPRKQDRNKSPSPTGLGQRVKDARREKGWSMPFLAERSGVNHASISGIENRSVYPRFDALMRIAVALDVTLEWLCEAELLAAQQKVLSGDV